MRQLQIQRLKQLPPFRLTADLAEPWDAVSPAEAANVQLPPRFIELVARRVFDDEHRIARDPACFAQQRGRILRVVQHEDQHADIDGFVSKRETSSIEAREALDRHAGQSDIAGERQRVIVVAEHIEHVPHAAADVEHGFAAVEERRNMA